MKSVRTGVKYLRAESAGRGRDFRYETGCAFVRRPVEPSLRQADANSVTAPTSRPITELLAAARAGDVEASDAVARAVHAELHRLAANYLRRERSDHTLEPNALVNEAYLRLLGQTEVEWKSRSHFFGIAAQVMRRLLVDHARYAHASRRSRDAAITLDDGVAAPDSVVLDVLGVHEALDRLAVLDPRQARVVELKFFVGLSIDEIAEVLGVSAATVSREWALARVWLQQSLSES